MIYRIEVTRKADKDIEKFDRKTLGRILARLNELAVNPLINEYPAQWKWGKGSANREWGTGKFSMK
jgi:mRNA-degrading endonuclease RelE of RelBE toxin-antitoxin system